MDSPDRDRIAHELRTAACVIAGLVDLLASPADVPLSADELHLLGAVERGAERVLGATRALRAAGASAP